MRNKTLDIIGITLSGFLWWLQVLKPFRGVPTNVWHFFHKWIYENSIIIGVYTVVTIVALHVLSWLLGNKNEQVWVNHVLQYILNQNFGGNNYHTRITIMKAEKGYRIIFKYIYKALLCNFFNNFREHTWKIYLRHIPIHLSSKYLVVYARYSYPNEDTNTFIHFRITKCDNGIAVKSFKEGQTLFMNTKNINTLNIPYKYENVDQREKRKIDKYMSDSYISRQNYTSLCLMRTRANNIWSTPLMRDNQQSWGVLIIDNDEVKEVKFQDKIDTTVESCIRILQLTLTSK